MIDSSRGQDSAGSLIAISHHARSCALDRFDIFDARIIDPHGTLAASLAVMRRDSSRLLNQRRADAAAVIADDDMRAGDAPACSQISFDLAVLEISAAFWRLLRPTKITKPSPPHDAQGSCRPPPTRGGVLPANSRDRANSVSLRRSASSSTPAPGHFQLRQEVQLQRRFSDQLRHILARGFGFGIAPEISFGIFQRRKFGIELDFQRRASRSYCARKAFCPAAMVY